MRTPALFLTLVTCLVLSCSCNNNNDTNNKIPDSTVSTIDPAPPVINYTVVKTYPHDTTSYTEGLFWLNNGLYESTGNYKQSELRVNSLITGQPIKKIKLGDEYFGEGISLINNKLYQLTYKEKKVFVYDPATFKKIKEFEWTTGEGWGMTHNDSELIISNGSSNLYYVDPETFKTKRIVGVTNNYGPVPAINELEYVKGVVYANVYETNTILKIDANTGKVLGTMDFTGILEKYGMPRPDEFYGEGSVLNGIAYDAAKSSFYITGKNWPTVFEIKLN